MLGWGGLRWVEVWDEMVGWWRGGEKKSQSYLAEEAARSDPDDVDRGAFDAVHLVDCHLAAVDKVPEGWRVGWVGLGWGGVGRDARMVAGAELTGTMVLVMAAGLVVLVLVMVRGSETLFVFAVAVTKPPPSPTLHPVVHGVASVTLLKDDLPRDEHDELVSQNVGEADDERAAQVLEEWAAIEAPLHHRRVEAGSQRDGEVVPEPVEARA